MAGSACAFPSQKDLTCQTVEVSSVLTSEIKAALLESTLYAPGGFLSQWPSSTRSPEMEQVATNAVSDHEIEIIPPTRDKRDDGVPLLSKKRLTSRTDADGCGICEECVAP